MSSSLIMNDMTSTPEENTSVRGIYASPDFTVKTSLLCHLVYHLFNLFTVQKMSLSIHPRCFSLDNLCFPAEKCFNDDGQLPLFQTGSGRSVTVSKGSIKRASAFLEPRNIAKELEGKSCSKHQMLPFFNCCSRLSFS